MSKNKPPATSPATHGGARQGAGRKAIFREATKPVRIPLSQVSAVRAFLHARLFAETAVAPHPVQPSPTPQSLPVFASGVRAGQEVVTAGVHLLRDGQTVRRLTHDPAQPVGTQAK